MKIFSYTLSSLLLLSAAPGVFGQNANPLETPARLDLAAALDGRILSISGHREHLVAVGQRGHVLTSGDCGQSWRQSEVPVSSDLTSVYLSGPKSGWAVGHDGVVLKTSDSGVSWEKVFSGRDFAGVIKADLADGDDSLDENQAYELQRVAEEADDKPFLGVYEAANREVFAFGAFNVAFHSEHGGANWHVLTPSIENPFGLHLYGMTSDGKTVYLMGERGLLLQWDEAQMAFEAIDSPYEGSWFGGISLNDGLVLFGLRGNAFIGRPGGEWRQIPLKTNASVTGASAIDEDSFVLGTLAGEVFRVELLDDGNSEVRKLDLDEQFPVFDVEVQCGRLHVAGANGIFSQDLQNN